ncbi:MAG TPA: hypothetical protein VGX23_27345 [Actinocrinis sp.]|nr:hypothetical protein [Actinocrinis sp.]
MSDQEVSAGAYTSSNVTRLLCAGTYLDAGFRKIVIRELLGNQHRVVAPSYGYDVVPVLAHALAAQRLRRTQVLSTLAGLPVVALLFVTQAVGPIAALVLFFWWGWVTGFMRRVATLDTLITRLRAPAGRGFDGHLPESAHLTSELIRKLDEEQATDGGLVYYGGYKPFVGAGAALPDWSSAELLIEARRPRDLSEATGGSRSEEERIIPFTVSDITSYVAQKLVSELRDNAKDEEKIRKLTVEKRRYAKATAHSSNWSEGYLVAAPKIHWEENYDAAREYLCIRIGSWEQEIVTSMFVGFDIKGNTLHTEFYPYVLLPIKSSFHVINRMPQNTEGVVIKAAFDALLTAPKDVISIMMNPFQDRLPRIVADGVEAGYDKVPLDGSDLGMAGYALRELDRGAVTSVRELATASGFHHFFQRSDTVKYRQIVERRLLQIIETFLAEHNVDLRDHHANQTTILNQAYGDVHSYGANAVVSQGNRGRQGFPRARTAPDAAKEMTH